MICCRPLRSDAASAALRLVVKATRSSATTTGRISSKTSRPDGQQDRVADPAVGRAEGALDEPGLDQPVDELGQAAAADHQRLGEVPHLHPVIVGGGDGVEDFVPGEGRQAGVGERVLQAPVTPACARQRAIQASR